MDELTQDEVEQALKIARELVDAGVPVFSAAPNSAKPGHYHLPKAWELTKPDQRQIDRWRPGWALGMVGGSGVLDALDFDPRNGGDHSYAELEKQEQLPRSFGRQSTPSGGIHDLISPTGERKCTDFMPGLDLIAGGDRPDERGTYGRAFIFISPTVRPSKAVETLGELHPYRWVDEPDLEYLSEFTPGADDTLDGVLARVQTYRAKGPQPQPGAADLGMQPRSESMEGADPLFAANPYAAAGLTGARTFTDEQMQSYVMPFIERVESARVGGIEESANALAAVLYHFVGSHFTAEYGMTLLENALAKTAYDPDGPSDWTAEKFRAVLDGSRPPADAWKAVRTAPPAMALATAPEPTEDAVAALLAEMLTPEEIKARPRTPLLVQGLLRMDSECWLIGAPGSKKSFVALHLAGCVSRGEPFMGLPVRRQGGVLIIAAEGGSGLAARIKAYEQEHGPMPDDVRILPRPVQSADAAGWRVLVEAARVLAPVLIIADTQARMTVGLDENGAKDMGLYVAAVSALRTATGACVLSVHHTKKDGSDIRGSGAIDGAADTRIMISQKEGLAGQLKVGKQKDLEEIAPISLTFVRHTVGVDEDGVDITSLALTSDPYRAAELVEERVEEWETGHGPAMIHLFKVLRDQGGASGLTKAEARASVVERFYGNKTAALNKSTWFTAWSRGQQKVSASGEPVMVNVSGERWVVDTEALATMPEGSFKGN